MSNKGANKCMHPTACTWLLFHPPYFNCKRALVSRFNSRLHVEVPESRLGNLEKLWTPEGWIQKGIAYYWIGLYGLCLIHVSRYVFQKNCYKMSLLPWPSDLALPFTHSPVNDPAPIPRTLIARTVHAIVIVHAPQS